MTIEDIQKKDKVVSSFIKLIVSLIWFFTKPFIIMLIFWVFLTLPFSLTCITYLQAFALQIIINLIRSIW